MSENRTRLSNLPLQFPRIFGKDSKDHVAFEHAAGWEHLLTLLSMRINAILDSDPEATMQVTQIKEKYGELHFYYRLSSANNAIHDAVDEAVDAACKASTSICETCGQPGTLQRKSGWFRVRCIDCTISVRLNN